jgi:nitrite reductase/ring-hydroxylating ferredoxin subunit
LAGHVAVATPFSSATCPLTMGRLEGYVVECPLHFARFDVRTRKLLSGPVSADEVLVDGHTVYVKR